MIALDSNIIIYFLEGHKIYGPIAADILRKVELGQLDAIGSDLVQFEVLASPLLDENMVDLHTQSLQQIGIAYIECSQEVLLRAAQIRRNHGFGAMDSIHVATAIAEGASHIVSNDRNLCQKSVSDIKIVPLTSWYDYAPDIVEWK